MLTRLPNTDLQESFSLPLDITAAVAATTTFPLQKMQYPYRIDALDVHALGGYTQDAANAYVITIQKGATVLATYSLITGHQGSLVAGTIGSGVLAATPTGAAGDQLDVKLTKNGTAVNFPAGSRIVARGRSL